MASETSSAQSPGEIASTLASHGYNADREAVELVANAPDPAAALDAVIAAADDDALVVSADDAEAVVEGLRARNAEQSTGSPDETMGVDNRGRETGATPETALSTAEEGVAPAPSGSGGRSDTDLTGTDAPGSDMTGSDMTGTDLTGTDATPAAVAEGDVEHTTPGTTGSVDRSPRPPTISGDVTGESTCTGEYGDFVQLFRDRFEQLSSALRGRVDHRPIDSIEGLPGGTDVGMIGLVNDIRSTVGGHRLIELEDTTGTFACLVTTDRDLPDEELVMDEVVAVEGTLADDGGLVFANSLRFPDVPRRYSPSTADRAVSAALVSDVHVGSNEFAADAWDRFADWLHTPEAADVEYLLIAGDMVEGVGVYPGQDEDLSIVDIYQQYEEFADRLKAVPGDLEIVMIPGNHDAVRLAEPQPGFREDLREIMAAHDATIVGNPSTVTVEGVSVLMYHGTSLDEVIARLPDASYDEPARAMTHLLKKRHLAPSYGGRTQIAPEHRDYLVVDEVPDVFHAGHVHKLGVTNYHGVTVINSGCWQAQTDFQRRNNIDPDYGYAPILDLETLDVTLRKFT